MGVSGITAQDALMARARQRADSRNKWAIPESLSTVGLGLLHGMFLEVRTAPQGGLNRLPARRVGLPFVDFAHPW